MIFNLKSNILLFMSLGALPASSQSYISVTPLLAIGTSFSKIKSDNYSTIKNNFASFFPKYGALIDFRKNKFGLSSGVSLSRTSTFNFSSIQNTFSQSVYVLAVPIIFSYDTKELNLFYIKRIHVSYDDDELSKSNFFLLSFKLRPFAGLNIDFVEKSHGSVQIANAYSYTQTTQYSVVNHNGVSAMIGLTMQFLQKGKERLALSFYYNQGLTNYLNASYIYTENNISLTANVVSKGTYIALGISYPIKIWDVEKRKSKKMLK